MKNFMNLGGIMLGAAMLCDKATDGCYNFEAGMKAQEEKDGKVEAAAVAEAKKQIQQEKPLYRKGFFLYNGTIEE